MTDPRDERIRFRRTHDTLRLDITRDPIFLFQRKKVIWTADTGCHWDSDRECLLDENDVEITDAQALERGLAVETWETETVFLTREDGEEWGRAHAYNYPSGWRIYCVAAKGDLVHVLADATVEGRYG